MQANSHCGAIDPRRIRQMMVGDNILSDNRSRGFKYVRIKYCYMVSFMIFRRVQNYRECLRTSNLCGGCFPIIKREWKYSELQVWTRERVRVMSKMIWFTNFTLILWEKLVIGTRISCVNRTMTTFSL